VVGAEAALTSADEATQEELLAGRALFLNAQTAPFQVLVRAEPVDLEGHLRRVQARAELLPAALRAIALDYIGFLQALAQLRTRSLDSRQVAELLHRCWSPELARVQRIRDELGAYTTLVVSSRQLARPKTTDEQSAATAESGVSLHGDAERLFVLGTRSLAD